MPFVGDDRADDHHDVEFLDDDGKRLGRARPVSADNRVTASDLHLSAV
jgi:hypothetical protein